MKKIIIAVSLLTTLYSCHPSGGSTVTPSNDTTFNGSYFTLTYSGTTKTIKGYTLKSTGYGATVGTTISGSLYQIGATDAASLSFTTAVLRFTYSGTGTGSFPVSKMSPAISGYTANSQLYYDTTGTVTITHQGTDYLQGSYTANMYGTGVTIPATGTFKVIY